MRALASRTPWLAALVSAAALAAACVGDDPEVPAAGSSSGGDGGSSSSSSSSSSSGGGGGGTDAGSSSSSSGGASSSGALIDGGTFSKGASRIHWHLLSHLGTPITCQDAGGHTMQIEALPLTLGNNNEVNSECPEDAMEGEVTVGNLAIDLSYTTDVLLYEHLDPADDVPLAASDLQDLDFTHGCNAIENDTCIRTFDVNVVLQP